MSNSITKKAIIPNKVPYNTIFLVFFSVMISLLAYKNPMLYELFYEKINPDLKWSWLTSIFLHGTGDLNTMINHLVGNIVIGVLIFGYMIENVLGTGKAFFYTLFSLIFTLFYSYISAHYGHGASNITYSFFGFGIFICIEYIKILKWNSFKKPFFIFLVLLISYNIISNINLYLVDTNIGGRNVHTISFILGIILSLLWSKDINNYFSSFKKIKYKYSSFDILSIIIICLISCFLIYSIFAVQQEIEDRKVLKEITQDISIPQTKQELNSNSGQIVVRFNEEMLPIIHSYYTSISVNSMYIPDFKWKWLDTKTLYIKINSPLGKDVNKYQIVFDNLRTLDYQSTDKKIELSIVK